MGRKYFSKDPDQLVMPEIHPATHSPPSSAQAAQRERSSSQPAKLNATTERRFDVTTAAAAALSPKPEALPSQPGRSRKFLTRTAAVIGLVGPLFVGIVAEGTRDAAVAYVKEQWLGLIHRKLAVVPLAPPTVTGSIPNAEPPAPPATPLIRPLPKRKPSVQTKNPFMEIGEAIDKFFGYQKKR